MTDDAHCQDFSELLKKQIREMREQFFKLDRLRNEAYGRKLQGDESAAAEMKNLEKQMARIFLSNRQIGVAIAEQRLETELELQSEHDRFTDPTSH